MSQVGSRHGAHSFTLGYGPAPPFPHPRFTAPAGHIRKMRRPRRLALFLRVAHAPARPSLSRMAYGSRKKKTSFQQIRLQQKKLARLYYLQFCINAVCLFNFLSSEPFPFHVTRHRSVILVPNFPSHSCFIINSFPSKTIPFRCWSVTYLWTSTRLARARKPLTINNRATTTIPLSST